MTTLIGYRPQTDPFSVAPRYPHDPPISPPSASVPTGPVRGMLPSFPEDRYSQQPSAAGARRATTAPNEFGLANQASSSQSTSAARSRASAAPTMMPTQPPADTSASAHAQRQRNRQSHNPSATLANVSPPKPEYLTDEYVLHPSVWAYKEAHPRRPMVGFGPYVLLQTLGEGEFGKVKLGVHTDYGVEVAIKLIRRGSLEDEVRASKVEREIDVLKVRTISALLGGANSQTLKHPNIVRMFDVIDTEKYIGIVLEFAGGEYNMSANMALTIGGELFDHILANRYLKEKDAQKLFAQLISGVDYLHKKHIVHRDLKLENLLLDKNRNIIITDFGFANRFDHASDDLMATSCGSPCYAAPELVVSEGLYVGSAVDIWSCGVILYAMLSGYLPYDDDPANPDGDNINLLYKYIMSTRLKFPDHLSTDAKHLLQIMLVPDPERRCGVSDIMGHPWLAGHRDLFARSVKDQEELFQVNMYRKSTAAKRELAARRLVQVEAKNAKMAMARSHSSAPGASVTAGMLEQNKRARDVKHHSALPSTTTMPEFLNNAGRRTPPVGRQPISVPPPVVAAAQTSPVMADAAIVMSPTSFPTPPVKPSPKPTPLAESALPMLPVSSATTQQSDIPSAAASTDAVENVAIDTQSAPTLASPSTPEKGVSPTRPPMSANKNRHTIQVEYDAEASYTYEQVKEIAEANEKAASGEAAVDASRTPALGTTSPHKRVMQLSAPGDYDMEDASSTEGHTVESAPVGSGAATPEATQVITPLASTPPAATILEEVQSEITMPSTPPQKTKMPVPVASPSTPRASRTDPEEVKTPRARPPAPTSASTTPKPLDVPRSGGKRFESMPARKLQPSKSDSMAPPSGPRRESALNPLGLPKPPSDKRDRNRKGMSLDKFGLAKLLGSNSSSVDVSRLPPSSGAAAASLQQRDENAQRVKRGSLVRPSTAGAEPSKEKKNRRRTLQLMVNRCVNGVQEEYHADGSSSSIRDSKTSINAPTTSAPLSAKDMNPPSSTPITAHSSLSRKAAPSPPTVFNAESSQAVVHDRGPSAASVVTVDNFSSQAAQDADRHQASSSAAKKVMDWFRRKSMAKDTLVQLKQGGVRSDSASSFVRVGESPVQPSRESRIAQNATNLGAMSSTSSVGHTQDAELANIREDTLPESATLPKESQATGQTEIIAAGLASALPLQAGSAPARTPLGPAANKVNVLQPGSVSATDLLSPARGDTLPFPRSKTSTQPQGSTSATLPSQVPPRSASSPRLDETKMRVHTGLVDQSALSSKPPVEVIHEVLRVLQEMGIEIKRENEFRFRCTRARRRKTGPTTGLGLGGVIGSGSGMSPFAAMTNASSSKVSQERSSSSGQS